MEPSCFETTEHAAGQVSKVDHVVVRQSFVPCLAVAEKCQVPAGLESCEMSNPSQQRRLVSAVID